MTTGQARVEQDPGKVDINESTWPWEMPSLESSTALWDRADLDPEK